MHQVAQPRQARRGADDALDPAWRSHARPFHHPFRSDPAAALRHRACGHVGDDLAGGGKPSGARRRHGGHPLHALHRRHAHPGRPQGRSRRSRMVPDVSPPRSRHPHRHAQTGARCGLRRAGAHRRRARAQPPRTPGALRADHAAPADPAPDGTGGALSVLGARHRTARHAPDAADRRIRRQRPAACPPTSTQATCCAPRPTGITCAGCAMPGTGR